MTQTTHTPGPWASAYHGHIYGANDQCVASIAIACDDRGAQSAVEVANAALIAAAPDLLAALQEAVNKGYMWDNDPKLWSKASAAIAKAKGQ